MIGGVGSGPPQKASTGAAAGFGAETTTSSPVVAVEVFETTAAGAASTDAVTGPAVETSMGTAEVAAAAVFKVMVAGGNETVDEAPDVVAAADAMTKESRGGCACFGAAPR